MTVDDGDILALGGLLDDNERRTIEKIPLLGDIPGLGALFRSRSKTHNKTSLMVFIRPTILRSREQAQATVRISRTQTGTLAPAFFARVPGGKEPMLQFVRAGWGNPDNMARASIQKVEYWWRDGRIERVGYPHVDGAVPDAPAVLLSDVTALSVRLRDARGDWREDWAPAQPDLMPRLVEMIVTRDGRQPLVMRFLVGPGGVEQPVVLPATGTGAGGG